jgi:oxalate decarboxylase/phosphoglucose isomerase-like protein (cupin superfamily)
MNYFKKDGFMDTVKQVKLEKNTWQDERGWGINPLDALGISDGFSGSMHLVSLKPGTARGNHYHTNTTEWIFVFGGKAKIVFKAAKEGSVRQIMVGASEPALFEIPPDVEHAVINTSMNDIYLTVICDAHAPETIRCPALSPISVNSIE